ncbi:chemotaxis protein CheD [Caldicoprobacter guelmensis]|uniref:chemotaxis protein CheD n=1 Tax=Caldicoprobacter guelmensis TaxID=1170224 RepID=UPI00195B3E36|nr:chemotaxis protein CheD [Caldicoprobacter guelmensis]MBM7581405.1 chemotaxis protein CheD [Caldicoprobacter guelmensis]
MDKVIKVGMADLKVTAGDGILVTLGLGSCVGIALYDRTTKTAGLAHIMLPSSKLIRNNQNKAKFADTAVEYLLELMLRMKAKREFITAKIAGGAQMFSFKGSASDVLNIGERNVQATVEVLRHYNIPIVAQDTGGNYGRTIELHADSGVLVVKTIGHGVKIL